jgi:Ca-activated chloride channel family protein
MNTIPDDPRWTAYLLGELEAAEQSECEAYLREHPEAAGVLDDLRTTARLVSEALQAEPNPDVSPALLQAVQTQLSKPAPATLAWRPRVMRLAAGLVSVAAALAVIALSLDRWKMDPAAPTEPASHGLGGAPAAPALARTLTHGETAETKGVERQAGEDREAEARLRNEFAAGPIPKEEAGIDLARVGESAKKVRSRGVMQSPIADITVEAMPKSELAFSGSGSHAPPADAPAPAPASAKAAGAGRDLDASRRENLATSAHSDALDAHPVATQTPAITPEKRDRSRESPDAYPPAIPDAQTFPAPASPGVQAGGTDAAPPTLAPHAGTQPGNAPAGPGQPGPTDSLSEPARASGDPNRSRGGTKGGGGRGTTGAIEGAALTGGSALPGQTPETPGQAAPAVSPPPDAMLGRDRADTRFMHMQRMPGGQGQAGGLAGDLAKNAAASRSGPIDGNRSMLAGQSASPASQPANAPGAGVAARELTERKLQNVAGQAPQSVTKEQLGSQAEQLARLEAQDEKEKLAEAAQRSRDQGPVGDLFQEIVENPFILAAQEPVSTFSVDVDTASYTYVRRMLRQGALPPRDAVRIEEMINYFTYDDPAPSPGSDPIAIRAEIAECPWNRDHALLRVNLKTRPVDVAGRPRANLVFLVDVSGSMDQPDKLPLVKASLRMLAQQLGENDKVAIVVYAGNAGLVLDSTSGLRRHEIASAIDQLEAGGSTNGGEGIHLAYQLARKHFVQGGQNRVILATDGDFNVGVTDRDALVELVAEQARNQIFLNVLSVGQGNLKDAMMEQIADKGNGVYAHLDSLDEARRVLVEQIGGTLVTVAKDVKLQLQFNPSRVREYRLIGYENRKLAHEDFADDRKDAGEMGAGHAVTAFYELQLDQNREGNIAQKQLIEDVVQIRVRYQPPAGGASKLIEAAVGDLPRPYALASADFRFGAAVASFGMLLRQSPHRGNASLDAVAELAGAALGPDKAGDRKEFVSLVRRARELMTTGGEPALAAPGGPEHPAAAPEAASAPAPAPAPTPASAPAPAPAPAEPPGPDRSAPSGPVPPPR